MNSRCAAGLAIFLVMLSAAEVLAQVPQILNYQGRVAVGSPAINYDGSGAFRFAFVNGDGTIVHWGNSADTAPADGVPDSAVALTVTKGLYSVLLGDTTVSNMAAIPNSVFANSDVRLRVWFDDGTNGVQQLAPDQRIAAVGYAIVAGSVDDGAITSAKIAAGAVGSTHLGNNLTLSGTTTGTFSGSGSGLTNVPFTIADGTVTGAMLASGVNLAGTTTGTFSGSGAGLTALNGSAISAGTVPDARLSTNVVLLDATQILTNKTITGSFTGPLSGNASTATNFTGALAGEVAGTQGATVVGSVGGVSASNVATGVNVANAATDSNTVSAIVRRDASGSFSAGMITATSGFSLPVTTGASVGIINQNGSRLIHSFGTNNFFAGSGAGNFTMSGAGLNTAVGAFALQANTTGTRNTASGYAALQSNTTGSYNIATGYTALQDNTTGSYNTATGHAALANSATSSFNAAYGYSALSANTSGSSNTASGYTALQDNTTGSNNTASGAAALANNTAGSDNLASGASALILNTTASQNVAVGTSALRSQSFSNGGTAWISNNVAIGYRALFANQPTSTSTGISNTAVGMNALAANTTGAGNIAIGNGAGNALTTGDNNIAIGHTGVAAETGIIRIGDGVTQTDTYLTGVVHGNGSGLTNIPQTAVAAPPPGMVLIPAGTFTMGGTSGDSDSNAVPVSVTVSAFYMDVNEVTLSQWQSVYYWASANGYSLNAGSGKGPNHPVQSVSWYDALKWCNARSEQEGKTPVYYTNDAQTTVYKTGNVDVTNIQVKWTANGYRLPTEAEWERAARGGRSGLRFPWGDTTNQNLANFTSNMPTYAYDLGPVGLNATGSVGGTTPATSPVGTFAANGYGLYDVIGNVHEWCWDWFGTPYSGGTDPQGPVSGSFRLIRGGSWEATPQLTRVSNRGVVGPSWTGSNNVGFRAVVNVGP